MKSIDFFFIIITALFSSIALSTFGEKPIISFGNVADIVSAFCNIAMAGAAVYAALNAKGWVNQKADEISLLLANKVICETCPNISISLGGITDPFNYIGDKVLFNSRERHDELVKTLELKDKDAWYLFKEIREFKKDIDTLERQGWVLKNKQKIFIDEFFSKIEEFYSIYLSASTRIQMLRWPDNEINDYDIVCDSIVTDIFDSVKNVKIHFGVIIRCLDEFQHSTKKVHDFFTKNTD
ncbi:Uncharacterised protein [Serratia proteamaculans]|uniref:hypothetical protein n=1 Tax=Serratia proteamaculans TaxID=28151 RepID=UPI001249D8F1|nr:hypothetical protein [Serratia proteamaculans]KAB1498447.1 hypothetical protein F8R23_03035 [Serratia proteamaculans]CAI0755254.1 Uncharacterised protein [Serratia proteamaculans]CAI0814240.1 Uncharacterised protein [Serratia proteamaculans]